MSVDQTIQLVRKFNRFYAQQIGALNDTVLGTGYRLTELRILHELYVTPGLTASQLAARLHIDEGFLSRTLAGLIQKNKVRRTRQDSDKRHYLLALTDEALAEQPEFEAREDLRVAGFLAEIPPEKLTQLASAMSTIEAILSRTPPSPVIFRQLQPGDAGWIIHRHGSTIAHEFGWNREFEALCAQIFADFIRNYRPQDERSWIVERDGEILGSLLLIRENETTARLRLLYVEPAARGMGLASKLLEKSIQFAGDKRYQTLVLFTTDSNVSARRIYTKLGMRLSKEETFSFAGKQQIGETWELKLTAEISSPSSEIPCAIPAL